MGGVGCAAGGGGCVIGFGVEDANPSADRRFVVARDLFFSRSLAFNPVTATYLGADGYIDALRDINGQLRDYSERALSQELAFYRQTQQELLAIDRTQLEPAMRVDYQLMDAHLKFLIRLIGDRKYHLRAIDTYVAEPFRGMDWQLQQMQDLEGGLRGTEEEWKLVVSRLNAIPGYLDSARGNLLRGKQSGNLPDRRMVQRDGIDGSRANAGYFRQTLPDSARDYLGNRAFGANLLPELKKSAERAAASWEAFAEFLKSTYDVNEKADRFAAGTEEYEWRVRNALGDGRTAAELFEYGAQQVALYSARIEEIAQKISQNAGLGLNFEKGRNNLALVRAVTTHLSKDSPASDTELFAWYRDTADRAVAYGRQQQMFEVPQSYKLDIMPTPQILRGSIEAAYYPAPPFKKAGVGRFYLSPTGNDPASLKLNNRASVATTAIHEGFPGHDWHYKFMTQHASEISNIRWLTPGAVEDSSSMWNDSMASEGWALYAEELMSEPVAGRPYGFYSAPEYLYELQGQMMRAVRVRVDVGIHTGRMTFEEARDYFAEHVHFYPGACATTNADARATCEVADRAIYRYSKWPTQAITYNLGKNAIVDLREAYKKKTGTAYSPKNFHEKFMRMGTVPVSYFREMFLM